MADNYINIDEYSLGVLSVDVEKNKANITNVYTLTESEADDYKLAIGKLDDQIRTDLESFILFDYACNGYDILEQNLKIAFQQQPSPNVKDALLQINASFLSVLNFMKTYLDHARTRHHSGLSDSAKKKTSYTKLTSEQFDNNFAYRFCDKLRNYSQHCGFPITGLQASSQLAENGSDATHSFRVYFDRLQLLNRYDSWGKILKPELESMDDDIDVLPILKDLHKSVTDLRNGLLREVIKSINKDYELVEKMSQKVASHEGTQLVTHLFGKIYTDGRKELQTQLLVIPVDLLEVIKSVRKETSTVE